MATTENIQHLMTEVGPVLDLLQVDQSTEVPHWTVAWDDGTVVALDLDEESDRLTLTGDAGQFDATSLPLANLLLAYNALWHQTGGTRLGVADGFVLVMHDVTASTLDLPLLSEVLTHFADRVRHWSSLVAHGAESTGASDTLLESFGLGLRA